jgi:hypothetical protein
MSLRRLLALSGSLEILARLLALISPAPVVSFQFEVPVVWDRSSPDAALRRWGVRAGATRMKARDDVQSPASPSVSIWFTTYNVPPAAVIIQTATGSDLGGLLLWGAGIWHAVLGASFVSAFET